MSVAMPKRLPHDAVVVKYSNLRENDLLVGEYVWEWQPLAPTTYLKKTCGMRDGQKVILDASYYMVRRSGWSYEKIWDVRPGDVVHGYVCNGMAFGGSYVRKVVRRISKLRLETRDGVWPNGNHIQTLLVEQGRSYANPKNVEALQRYLESFIRG